MTEIAPQRPKWKPDSEYMCTLHLQNTLPTINSGNPYFKQIGLNINHSEFAVYKETNFEKSYIWQPHFGLALGLNVDLVDSELLASKTIDKKDIQLDEADKKLIGIASKSARGGKVEDLPWWLRNPIYLENNLYEKTNKFKTSVQSITRDIRDTKNIHELNRQIEADDSIHNNNNNSVSAANTSHRNIFQTEIANKSFELVVKQESALRLTSNNSKEIEYCVPLIPHGEYTSRLLSYIKFDENPITNISEESSVYSANTNSNQWKKRVHSNILMNARVLVGANNASGESSNSRVMGKNNSFGMSLIVPPAIAGEEGEEGVDSEGGVTSTDEDDLFGSEDEDDEVGKQDKMKSNKKSRNDDTLPYKWCQDYKSEVQNKQLQQSFVIYIPEHSSTTTTTTTNNNNNNSAAAVYFPLKSQITLKKLPYTETNPIPQEVLVLRKVSN